MDSVSTYRRSHQLRTRNVLKRRGGGTAHPARYHESGYSCVLTSVARERCSGVSASGERTRCSFIRPALGFEVACNEVLTDSGNFYMPPVAGSRATMPMSPPMSFTLEGAAI